jgi:hypothetical protein
MSFHYSGKAMRRLIGLAALATAQCACHSATAQPIYPFDATSASGGQVYYFDGTLAVPLSSTSVVEGNERRGSIGLMPRSLALPRALSRL